MSGPEKKRVQASYTKVAENLYRNDSSGTYYALVKRSGKQIKKALQTKDPQIAKRRLRGLLETLDRKTPKALNVAILFREMGERWLKVVKPHLKDSSYRRRQTSLRMLNASFGNLNVRSISRRTCEDWASRRAPTCKPSTFNIDRETLISVLQYAEEEGIILDNPARVVKKRKLAKTDLRIPSLDHLQRILKHLRSLDVRYHRSADLVELLAWSGMRKAEANALRWGDIDWERNLFTVTGGAVGTKNHEVRHVPIFPQFKEFLERMKAQYLQELCELDASAPVVLNQNAKKGLEAACRNLELPHYNHHSMRHFFVSLAIEKGIDFKTIAAWVGHKDGGILVAQTYGHLRDAHSIEMAKLMKV